MPELARLTPQRRLTERLFRGIFHNLKEPPMDQPRTTLLRQLPAVDELLRHPRLAPLVAGMTQ